MTTTVFETRTRPRVEKEGGGTFTHVRPPRRVRVVGYVRQSFEEMDRKRTRPGDQKGRIAACADTHDWHLVNTFEDTGWSGGDLDRPGLLALLSSLDFEIVIVERTDRLTSNKKDLDFLLSLLDKRGITCVPATWSWEPLAQYMRWWYRLRANPVYALLDAPPARSEPGPARAQPLAGLAGGLN